MLIVTVGSIARGPAILCIGNLYPTSHIDLDSTTNKIEQDPEQWPKKVECRPIYIVIAQYAAVISRAKSVDELDSTSFIRCRSQTHQTPVDSTLRVMRGSPNEIVVRAKKCSSMAEMIQLAV